MKITTIDMSEHCLRDALALPHTISLQSVNSYIDDQGRLLIRLELGGDLDGEDLPEGHCVLEYHRTPETVRLAFVPTGDLK